MAAVTREELVALLASDLSTFAGDRARIRDLIERMVAASDAHAEALHRLRRSVEEIRHHATTNAPTGSLAAAVAAFETLDENAREQVIGAVAAGEIAKLRETAARVARTGMAATSRENRVALALAALTSDPDIPADVKDRLRHHLEDVAADAGQWPTPDVEVTIDAAQQTLESATPPTPNPFAGLFAP